MKDFLRLPLDWNDFPDEPIPADGTLAHALERLMLIFASPYPGRGYRLHRGDSIPDYRCYEDQQDFSALVAKSDVKVLAYYLPQFHPTPENDRWHGEGFTEWSKVREANPLFEGHYQQHIPHPDIGYYSIESPDMLRRQADLMRKAGVERVLHDWTAGAVPEMKERLRAYQPLRGSVLDYDQVADFYSARTSPGDFTWFRSIVPIWDNTARYGSDAFLVHGSTPRKFAQWLKALVAFSRAHLPPDRRFIMVNAWNEWAEGAHLEPDSRYGYAYLNAVGRTLAGIAYGADLNPVETLPPKLRIRLVVADEVLDALREDKRLEERFIACLAQSTFFEHCDVEIHPPRLIGALPAAVRADVSKPAERPVDWILQVRRVALFPPDLIEKMLQTACRVPRSVVISNAYDRHFPLIEATENGSVDAARAFEAPLVLMPADPGPQGYKNYRLRADTHSFVAYPNTLPPKKLPRVTTIIRYHRKNDMGLLRNALYSLAAMQDCVVLPLIAAQDLDSEADAALRDLLGQLPWPEGRDARVLHFASPEGKGDLRARMLNEALKQVSTRYAGFLDYDDLLMSHAYGWLLERLRRTGKAVAFGRVYSTFYDRETGLFRGRKREFTHGFSYDDFVACNHAPLHSFLLDLDQLDLKRVHYHDDQRYLEDYFLTLQLFTRENADWESLGENAYIGDYLHVVGGANTLAMANEEAHQAIVKSPAYRLSVNNAWKRYAVPFTTPEGSKRSTSTDYTD